MDSRAPLETWTSYDSGPRDRDTFAMCSLYRTGALMQGDKASEGNGWGYSRFVFLEETSGFLKLLQPGMPRIFYAMARMNIVIAC